MYVSDAHGATLVRTLITGLISKNKMIILLLLPTPIGLFNALYFIA